MKFDIIDKEQYVKDFVHCYLYDNLNIAIDHFDSTVENKSLRAELLASMTWEQLVKPKRATKGSAGYDFFFPMELRIPEGVVIKIPTGIVWNAKDEIDKYVLMLYPRSSLGIYYSLRQPNLISVIDSDYYGNATNHGHIFYFAHNEGSNGTCIIRMGSGYCQGIIQRFYTVEDDDSSDLRTGGCGSTNKVVR